MAEITPAEIISISATYKRESEAARLPRIQQNKINFDCYHMRQDFSYKTNGQSQEFLPKLKMAIEQSANFMQQGLVDQDEWFRTFASPGLNEDMMKVKPAWMQLLLQRQLEKTAFPQFVGNASKNGFLGALMIAKIGGQYKPKVKYKVENKMQNGSLRKRLIKIDDKRWQLDVALVQQEDFGIDPTGRGLYRYNDIYMDLYEVVQMSKGKEAIYDAAIVEQLKGSAGNVSSMRDYTKSRETNQGTANNGNRRQIKITEYWGNILSPDGELLFENVVWSIANDTYLIQKPTPNPLWHGQDPYEVCPIITVPGSVWGAALADAPAALNMALNEMFNLILDGGMMAVHGIKQLREHWLVDPSQIEDGIAAGDTLLVNTACPPGMTALERVDTATVPADGINVYNLLNQEFNTAANTNDLRMGAQPFRQVKATEVVESSQANSTMFNGLAEHMEANFIKPILVKSWMTCAQYMDDLDEDELRSYLGEEAQKKILAMGPEELFADTVQGAQFEVFGISATLNKQKDFTKLQAMMQTIAGSPPLMEAFVAKYDFGKYLGEIMRSLDINTAKLEHGDPPATPTEPAQTQMPGQMPGEVPDAQSQIPQAGSAANAGADTMGAIPQPDFPASRATPRAG